MRTFALALAPVVLGPASRARAVRGRALHGGLKFRTCLLVIAVLAGLSGESRAAIIVGPLPDGAGVLQLPDRDQRTIPFQEPIRGFDPRVGGFRFDSGNRLISRSDTDTITGLADFEGLRFALDMPVAPLTGLAFTFSSTEAAQSFAEVDLFDQDNNIYRFRYPQPGTKFVSFLATGGDTIRGFSIGTRQLNNPVGPFLVSTAVPEPSTLALGGIGLAVLAGAARRRKRAAA